MPKLVCLKDKVDGNELDLSLCNMDTVPVKEIAAIPKAIYLDLSCNLLDVLPDTFCSLTHLVKVDLSKNKLVALPTGFGRLTNLQHLDLLGNHLTTLPESFSRLRKLKWLDLKDNQLEPGLLKNAGDCLNEKQCKACAQRILLYMKEFSSAMERKRQKELKILREEDARKKALEEAEMKRKREQKKAEKRQRQKGSACVASTPLHIDNISEQITYRGDCCMNADEETDKKDKSGRRECSYLLVLVATITLVTVSLIAVVSHCNTYSSEHYCESYINPVSADVSHTFQHFKKQVGGILSLGVELISRWIHTWVPIGLDVLESGWHLLSDIYSSAVNIVSNCDAEKGGNSDT